MIIDQPWLDSHTKLSFGAIAEDTVAISLLHTSRGRTTVARPLVDLGFDGYARRVGTLHVVPYQVKARRTLNPSGLLLYRVRAVSVHRDPKAAIVFEYFPPPGPAPFPRLFVVPMPYFVAHCPRDTAYPDYFKFNAGLKGAKRGAWVRFFYDYATLQQQWLDPLPGWKEAPAVLPGAAAAPSAASGPEHKPRGMSAELLIAGQLQIQGGHRLIVAMDRVRVDPVSLLLHDLVHYRIGGLAIHTSLPYADKRLVVSFGKSAFFTDDRFWLVILGLSKTGAFHETSFLIPSRVVPTLIPATDLGNGTRGYRASIGLDPISRAYRPYAVPTADLARTILKKVLG